MRHPVFAIGALLLFLVPTFASAAIDCEDLAGVRAISQHYVQPALDRANEGIEYASEAETNTDFFSLYLPFWARSVAGSFAQIVDSRQRLTAREGDLADTTACLRYDQILLECKIDDVRKALDEHIERGSYMAIMRLQSLLTFLQERLYHLDLGAADGSYEDAQWATQRSFDRVEPAELDGPLCPFHSDYTPPRLTGYGCDTFVLGAIGGHGLDFVDTELQGLSTIEREIDAFREIVPLLNSIQAPGTDPNSFPTSISSREHKTIIGCQEETGFCSDDDSLVCGSDEFCASKGKGECERGEREPPIPKRALRGPFAYQKDHLQILTDFIDKRIEDGVSRTFPAGWARTEDLPDGSADAEMREQDDISLGLARAGLRTFFRSVSGIQGRFEGAIFPEAVDTQLEIANSLSDMRASIGELSRLAGTKEGVRAFVVDLAYFLRRACAWRPCQKSLEQVLRITLQDACFPYTNGEFLDDTEQNPRWKKCAEAACIAVDGVTLSGSCDGILPE